LNETELAEIEGRILEYPVEARRDIIRLASELRSLRGFSATAQASGGLSPLYDSVTGLLNGGAFGVRFAGARARAARYQKGFAVMSIDVVLSKGTPRPDEYDVALKLVAERLQHSVRATDTLARTDHEKFAIILEDLAQDGQTHLVTEKVQRTLSEPLDVGGRKIYLDASVSLKFYPASENAGARSRLDSRVTP
jgi:diguanylate cyclase (GGDEF)-like protein